MIRDDARSLRLPGRFGTVCRDASGPTIRLSRAAERATIERHGHVKEYMFVNRRWRRRLQAAVGPGHGRRRVFGSPDHDHGRDSEVADTGRNRTRRDLATDRTSRDPATDRTARDDHPSCRAQRRAVPHATISTGRDPATGHTARDGPDRT